MPWGTHLSRPGLALGASGNDSIFLFGCGVWLAEVPNCVLSSGLKESPIIPLAESELLAEILQEVRKIIGVTFSQDKR